jgi:hypothetical protein
MPANPGNKSPKSKLWLFLIWAIFPAVVIAGTFLYDVPDIVEAIYLTCVWLPAGIICEKLGFGAFSMVGASTIPIWIFFTAILATSYLYGLILVFLVSFVIRLGKRLYGSRNSKE